MPSQPSETTPSSMTAARSVCDREAATCSSEPIASAATDRTPSTITPATAPSAESAPPIRTTTKSLNERNGPYAAGSPTPARCTASAPARPATVPDPPSASRPQADDRHVQRGGRRLAFARGGELQADRRAGERGVAEHREQCEHECELVVLAPATAPGDDDSPRPAERPLIDCSANATSHETIQVAAAKPAGGRRAKAAPTAAPAAARPRPLRRPRRARSSRGAPRRPRRSR